MLTSVFRIYFVFYPVKVLCNRPLIEQKSYCCALRYIYCINIECVVLWKEELYTTYSFRQMLLYGNNKYSLTTTHFVL